MVDPRLNSVHLEAPRREDYRRAREALLNARGPQTMAAEGEPARPAGIAEYPRARVPDSMRFWLLDGEAVYPLKVGLNTVGRAPENDVVVPDGYVSRRHCVILVHAGRGCELHDTASKNGTFVNGARLDGPTRLKPGDEIRMCDCRLVFVADAAEPRPASPSSSSHTHLE
jgi:hypothetical protein